MATVARLTPMAMVPVGVGVDQVGVGVDQVIGAEPGSPLDPLSAATSTPITPSSVATSSPLELSSDAALSPLDLSSDAGPSHPFVVCGVLGVKRQIGVR